MELEELQIQHLEAHPLPRRPDQQDSPRFRPVQAIAQREAIIMFLKVEQKDARHVQDIWRAFS
jgi:hypothetical protein